MIIIRITVDIKYKRLDKKLASLTIKGNFPNCISQLATLYCSILAAWCTKISQTIICHLASHVHSPNLSHAKHLLLILTMVH